MIELISSFLSLWWFVDDRVILCQKGEIIFNAVKSIQEKPKANNKQKIKCKKMLLSSMVEYGTQGFIEKLHVYLVASPFQFISQKFACCLLWCLFNMATWNTRVLHISQSLKYYTNETDFIFRWYKNMNTTFLLSKKKGHDDRMSDILHRKSQYIAVVY